MTNKPKIMGNLGTAAGAVRRCLDIIARNHKRSLTSGEENEIVGKLQTAERAILIIADELEKEP